MNRIVFGLTAALLMAGGGRAEAAFVRMEGIAPAGSTTTEFDSTRLIDGFNVFVRHGHYWDSAGPGIVSGSRPNNGTDTGCSTTILGE